MIVYGIDPGTSGGIARLDSLVGPAVFPMPYRKGVGVDIDAVRKILNWEGVAFVEHLWPMPIAQGGVKANYGRGAAMEFWRVLLYGLAIPRRLVAPQTWQNEMLPLRGGSTKDRSIAKARELFPGVSLFATPRSRKPSDGLSDSLLIARYGQIVLERGKQKWIHDGPLWPKHRRAVL